jgi:hypothetical protein
VGGWASVWALVAFLAVAAYAWARPAGQPAGTAEPSVPAGAAEMPVPAETETPGAPRV